MPAERIIGVDFGTSTSVIRVKRYQNGKPIGDHLGTEKVTFNMGSTMVPTLIQKLSSGDAYFGYDADIPRRKTKTFQNFKVDIENPDEDIRRQARELTAEYFTYMAKTYRTQSEGGHLGESGDEERTIISYPVKWSDESKAFLVQVAKDAGFPNVEGIDEAQAAIQAVTIQNAELLTRKGYFRDSVSVNILLIDMGAGTTDLVLCRHTPGKSPKTDILSTWPQRGNALFGGREVDELLKSYICRTMPEEDTEVVLRKIGLEKYKAWKESIVSPALEKGETVDSFAALDDLLDVLESEAEYSVDRNSFELHAADYLRQLPELVNGCVQTSGLSGNDVDLVILTGGHSQWYFVREMLSGKLDRFGKIGLGKILADPHRIIPIALPQETVALGLVYGPLKLNPPEPLVYVPGEEPTCTEEGHTEAWHRASDGTYFADKDGLQQIDPQGIAIPALGHALEWAMEDGERIQRCRRCGCVVLRVKDKPQVPAPTFAPKVQESEPVRDTPDSEFILNSVGEGYEIQKYTGTSTVVRIPSHIRGRQVVSIGTSAFGGGTKFRANQKIEKVVIPKTITNIGPVAFAACMNLKTIIAHDGIQSIGMNAFWGCNKLEIMDFGMGECIPHVVTFPPALKEIGAQAFLKAGALTLTTSGGTIFREVNLSKKTKLKSALGMNKAFLKKDCAIFYYD